MSIRSNPTENRISLLSDELLFDICSRLRAKDLGKFRCVDKKWEALLRCPDFIKHYTRRNSNSNSHLLARDSRSLYLVDGHAGAATRFSAYAMDENGIVVLRPMEGHKFTLLGSCDGLVLVSITEDKALFIVNPTTRQLFEVSQSPPHAIDFKEKFVRGFGYDKYNDDYKIVSVSDRNFVDVYSVKMKIWNTAADLDSCYTLQLTNSAVFVGGCLHWAAYNL